MENAMEMDQPEMMALMEEDKKSASAASSASSEETWDGVLKEEDACPCCCCLCNCSNPKTVDLKCFGCFPIKAGVVAIGTSMIILTIALYIEVFWMLLNDHIHWWYVVIAVLLLVPACIASSFFVVFFSNDNNDTRGRLDPACYMFIISVTLLGLWNLIYFLAWYKNREVIWGNDYTGFRTQTTKEYIFWSLFVVCWLDFWFGYFICVCRRYWYVLRDKKAEREAKKKEEEEKKAKK